MSRYGYSESSDIGKMVKISEYKINQNGKDYYIQMWNDQRGMTIEEKPMRTIEDLKEGDVLDCGDGDRKKVLGVVGQAIITSKCNRFDESDQPCTLEQIRAKGWTLHQEPEPKKVTFSQEQFDKITKLWEVSFTYDSFKERLKSMVE